MEKNGWQQRKRKLGLDRVLSDNGEVFLRHPSSVKEHKHRLRMRRLIPEENINNTSLRESFNYGEVLLQEGVSHLVQDCYLVTFSKHQKH